MSSVIILGDVHLGKGVNIGRAGVGSNLNSRIVDQLNLLDWTLDQAIEAHADHIIITGDVFEDTKPSPSLITLFIGWLKKCQIHGIHVHIIMGNHDVIRSGSLNISSLDIISEMDMEDITVYKNINTVFIDTSAFTLIPYRDRKFYGTMSNADALETLRESLVYELASVPLTYQKFIVGHLAIEGSIPVGDEIDDITNELFCPLDMFNGYDCVWMGHVHKPQVMKKNPHISHIGSMDISNFGETDHKKHILVVSCLKGESDPVWKKINLPTRTLKTISIIVPKDTVDNTKFVLNELKNLSELDKATVKVDISLSSPDLKPIVKSDVEKYLTAQGVFNVTSISQTKKSVVIKKDRKSVV